MPQERVDLVEAATRLRIAYHVAYRLVLTGGLRAERRNGRWFVDRQDLERLEGERKTSLGPAPERTPAGGALR